jgi:hypothetical protein
MSVTGSTAECAAGPVTLAVSKTETAGGRTAFVETDSCYKSTEDYSVNAGQIEILNGTFWDVSLAAPVQDGHSWLYGTVTFTWQRIGSVTVQAGTFADCWSRMTSPSGLQVATYCNHVGPVRYVAPDWKQELVSYTLK